MRVVRSLEKNYKQDEIRTLFSEVMGSGEYAEGKNVAIAEEHIEAIYGQQTVLMNSCGSALYSLFRYVNRNAPHVSRAVIQNNTFYATAAMLLEAAITPVLCDSREDCPSMSYQSMVRAVEMSRAKMVVLTHIGGWVARDYELIAQYCKTHKILLVEDCAHAFGLTDVDTLPGSLGWASAWSFYPTKSVPIGDGGAVMSTDQACIDWCRKFRNYGKEKDDQGVIQYGPGFNFRISEWNAAVLRVQLRHLPQIIQARRRDAQVLSYVVGPPLLRGQSNFYKYPVSRVDGRDCKTVGKIYGRSDQIDEALGSQVMIGDDLTESHCWARDHVCIPMGEGIYDGISRPLVEKLLCKSDK